MSDLIRQLRQLNRDFNEGRWLQEDDIEKIISGAADEIERLRKWQQEMVEMQASGGRLDGYREMGRQLAAKDAEIERLQAALREMDAIPCKDQCPSLFRKTERLQAPCDCIGGKLRRIARQALKENRDE